MAKKIRILLNIILIILLVACNSVDNKTKIDNETKNNQTKATFTGSIVDINGQTALVNVEEGDILKSGNSVHVGLSDKSGAKFKVGDKVRVGYEGEIRESDPLGINVVSVELLE